MMSDGARTARSRRFVGRLPTRPEASSGHFFHAALGLQLKESDDVPPENAERAAALDAARAAKDFATADTIRSTLQAEGWIVETTKLGTSVRH